MAWEPAPGLQDAPDGWEVGDPIPDGFEDAELNATNINAWLEHAYDKALEDAPGAAVDAAAATKGITRLSAAPASPTVPIAVGTNDARVTADQAAGTASIRTLGTGSAQAAAGDHSHTGLTAQAAGTPSVRAIGATGTTVVAGNDSRLTAGAAGVETVRAIGTTSTTACAGDDARLTNTRTPTDGTVTAAKVAAALKPSGTAATTDEALRALGTAGGTAAAGNDARLPTSDQKAALGAGLGTIDATNPVISLDAMAVANGPVLQAEDGTWPFRPTLHGQEMTWPLEWHAWPGNTDVPPEAELDAPVGERYMLARDAYIPTPAESSGS